MISRLYGVYGVGGCGRSVMPLVYQQIQKKCEENTDIVFIDDNFDGCSANGYPVISFDDFVFDPAVDKFKYLRTNTFYQNNTTEISDRSRRNCWFISPFFYIWIVIRISSRRCGYDLHCANTSDNNGRIFSR